MALHKDKRNYNITITFIQHFRNLGSAKAGRKRPTTSNLLDVSSIVEQLRESTVSSRAKSAPIRGRERAGHSSHEYVWTGLKVYDSAQYFQYNRLGDSKPTTQCAGFSAYGRNIASNVAKLSRPSTCATRRIISRLSVP